MDDLELMDNLELTEETEEPLKYKLHFDDQDYITGYEHTGTEEDIYEIDFSTFNDRYLCAYKLIDGEFVLDEERARQIDNMASWQETVDAQLSYTAMMTDTLLNEE